MRGCLLMFDGTLAQVSLPIWLSGWWFQNLYFMFILYLGKMNPIRLIFFKWVGWNHQLAIHWLVTLYVFHHIQGVCHFRPNNLVDFAAAESLRSFHLSTLEIRECSRANRARLMSCQERPTMFCPESEIDATMKPKLQRPASKISV